MSFLPLDRDIRSSSLWVNGTADELKVFLYLLLSADSGGVVPDSDPGIANACGLTIDQALTVLDALGAPDPYSRTKNHEGRRIERREDGRWVVLNYEQYANKDHSSIRAKRYRKRRSENRDASRCVTDRHGASRCVTDRHGASRQGVTARDEIVAATNNNNNNNDTNKDLNLLAGSSECYWDNATQSVVIDLEWLSKELHEYETQIGYKLTTADIEQRTEHIRRELLREPRLRACIQKSNGKPSSKSQFKRFRTYVVSRFKETVDYRSRAPTWKKPPPVDDSATWVETEADRQAERDAQRAISECEVDHNNKANLEPGREWAACKAACGYMERM